MNKIKLENIKLSYFKTPALTIDKLEFFKVGVIGASGAGKTNLIKILSGLEEIDSGNIFIGDKEIGAIKSKNREISLLSSSTPLFINKSVYFNLSYPLRKRGIKKSEVEKKIIEISSEFELTELDRKVKDLFEKEKIRVMIARAFVKDIKLLLVDEPITFIDDVDYFYEILSKMCDNHMFSAVFCTYDYDAIKDLVDKIIILNQGKIIFEGSDDSLKNCTDEYIRALCFLSKEEIYEYIRD
ncbi:MAG: ATP-binding cassette domain-containing protein [Firmicutes bacterium]|nr:ATP-binding cassette domain-containing protein [Bacillota bacterium]